MKKFFYRVEEGDSVLSLADRFEVPALTIIKLNNLKSEVSAGDLLFIKACEKTYRIGIFDTVNSVSEKFGVSAERLKEKNGTEYFYYGQLIEI